jgi:cytochrome P450
MNREQVLELFGTESRPKEQMTWDNLRLCTTLQYAIYETLRRYLALPNISRNAIRDTILPRRGGPDGSCPIVVPKGEPVTCYLYLMHRREQEWGSDPEAFKTERCKLYAVCIFVELI